MARVVCVGNATLDIINTVASYPPEDSEVRAVAQGRRTGGNAANTAMVLSQLGDSVAWIGSLAASAETADRDFARYRVDTANAVRIADAVMPTSYISLSRATGSRSIVHYRDLPEYPAEAFLRLDLRGVDWVHFEGRNLPQLAEMLAHARAAAVPGVSLELEKPRPGIEGLFDRADILMCSRDYALARGFTAATDLLQALPPGPAVTCTWGARGAWARGRDGRVLHAEAHAPSRVVDTLGAGDVFNAALIHALAAGSGLEPALREAVELAAAQCTREGLELGA